MIEKKQRHPKEAPQIILVIAIGFVPLERRQRRYQPFQQLPRLVTG